MIWHNPLSTHTIAYGLQKQMFVCICVEIFAYFTASVETICSLDKSDTGYAIIFIQVKFISLQHRTLFYNLLLKFELVLEIKMSDQNQTTPTINHWII